MFAPPLQQQQQQSDMYGFNIKLVPTDNLPSEESLIGWSVDNTHASQHSLEESPQDQYYSPDENSSLILTVTASNSSPATIQNNDYFRIEEDEHPDSPTFSYSKESQQEISLRKVQIIQPKKIVINTKQYLK